MIATGCSPDASQLQKQNCLKFKMRPTLASSWLSEAHRSEVARLAISSIAQKGYPDIAIDLAQATKIQVEPDSYRDFKAKMMDNDWEGVYSLLDKLEFRDEAALNAAAVDLKKQRYLELVDCGEITDALLFLKNEYAPLAGDEAAQKLTWSLFHSKDKRVEQGMTPKPANLVYEDIVGRLKPGIIVHPQRFNQLIEYAKLFDNLLLVPTAQLTKFEPLGLDSIGALSEKLVLCACRWLGQHAVERKLEAVFGHQLMSSRAIVLKEFVETNQWKQAVGYVLDNLDMFRVGCASLSVEIIMNTAISNGGPDFFSELDQIFSDISERMPDVDLIGYTHDTDNTWAYITELFKPDIYMSDTFLSSVLYHALVYQVITDRFWCGDIDALSKISLLFDIQGSYDDLPRFCKLEKTVSIESDWIYEVAFNSDGKFLAVGTRLGDLVIYNTSDYSVVYNGKQYHEGGLTTMQWSPDSKYLVTGGENGYVGVWDLANKQRLLSIKQHEEGVGAVCWLPDSSHFVSGGCDNFIHMWDLQGTRKWSYQGIRVRSFAIMPDNEHLIALCAHSLSEQEIYKFKIKTLSYAEFALIQNATLTSLAISHDGVFATNCVPDCVRLWTWHDNQKQLQLIGPLQSDNAIKSCFGGPFDKFVVSGSEDNVVYIFNRFTGVRVAFWPCHNKMVNTCKWAPGGNAFVSAGDDGVIKLWVPSKMAQVSA